MNTAAKSLPTGLTFECDPRGDSVVVHLRGRASFDQAPVLDRCVEAIHAHGQRRIVLDLSELSYIGSAGLGTFIALKRTIEAQQGSVVVAGMNPLVHDLFQTAGLTQYFTVFTTAEEALGKD